MTDLDVAPVDATTPGIRYTLIDVDAHITESPDTWTSRVAAEYGYAVTIRGVGDPDPVTGAPTQLALFRTTEVTA